MKHIITISLTVLITLFFISCKKELLSDSYNQATIFKKWGILNDSTFIGVGVNNHPVKYVGQAGDYFDFRKDGYIYIKEGPTLDTLSYSFTSNTTLLIASFGVILNGVPEKSHITNLTPGGVTISAPFVVTPGGVFGRKVILTR
jgi:hypothetical protein